MVDQPWPSAATEQVLFILDASHSVEEHLLRSWLQAERERITFGGQSRDVLIPIARDPEGIRSQPLLAELQQAPETLVVPVRVVWSSSLDVKGTTPRLRDFIRGNPRRPRPGQAQKILRSEPDRARCIAGDSATLGELRARLAHRLGDAPDNMQLAEFIAGQAGLALDIAERQLRGSRYKVPRRVAGNLQSSARFKEALEQIAVDTGTPVQDLRTESVAIMKELIATPRAFWLDVMAMFNRRMITLGYESDIVVDEAGMERIREVTREYPAAILWTHKTHVDGFATQHMFFHHDFPVPHTLGGVNMAFAGLGFLARRAGAIFIRRSFQDNPLYKMILRQYIAYLLEKRFPLSWAFEGTRSRVGKLMPPRYGLLKYVVEAAHGAGMRDLHIIPISISYDLIGDVADYASEQSGATKQPESLRWFIGYLRGLRQPMGRIYMDFGEPVVLEQAPSAEDRLALAKIAFQVGVEVNRVTPITLASLVTMILLGAAPRALTREELVAQMSALVDWASARDIRVTSVLEPDNTDQLNSLAEVLTGNGLITRYDEGPEEVYAIAPEQHGVAGYYRNTTIHHFVTKAVAELALLQLSQDGAAGLAGFWAEVDRIRDLFKFEFFYAPTAAFHDQLRDEVGRYDTGWEVALADDPAAAGALLARFKPLVAPSTLLTFAEAYRVVADVLARLDHTVSLEEKECISQSLAYGRQAYLQRRISSEASIGKLLFQNAYKLMANRGLTDGGDAVVGEQRRALSQELRDLAHRIDRLRAMTLSGQ